MTFKQFFPISVGIAILAFFLVLISLGASKCPNYGHYFVLWVAFQTWAMYFMAGCTIPGGVKVLLGYTGGITASIGVMELAGQLSVVGGLAAAVAVLIIVVPIICFERVPWMDFIPAWFVGSGAFFALSEIRSLDVFPAGHLQVMGAELFSCFIGILFGVVTVILRGKYEASLKLDAKE
jgi:hypothetical protein